MDNFKRLKFWILQIPASKLNAIRALNRNKEDHDSHLDSDVIWMVDNFKETFLCMPLFGTLFCCRLCGTFVWLEVLYKHFECMMITESWTHWVILQFQETVYIEGILIVVDITCSYSSTFFAQLCNWLLQKPKDIAHLCN